VADKVEEGFDLMMLLGLAAAAYGVYWLFKQLPSINSPDGLGTSIANGIGAGVNSVQTALANAFESLTFSPMVQVAGDIYSQSGQLLGPVAQFPAATYGSYTYLNINGTIYQMGAGATAGSYVAIPTGVIQPAGGAPAAATPLLVASKGLVPSGSTAPASAAGSALGPPTGITFGTGATANPGAT
jgi:hypothetical protein